MGTLAKQKVDINKVVTVMAVMAIGVLAAMLLATQPVFAAAGINKLFGEAKNIAEAVKTGFQGLVIVVGVAVLVYTALRMFLSSDERETKMYQKRIIAIIFIALVAFLAPELINWVQSVADGIKLN